MTVPLGNFTFFYQYPERRWNQHL